MTDKLAGLSTLRESLDTFLISSVLNAKDLSTLQGSTAASKESLSLNTMSINFRKFVQKSGPIFAAQDSLEKILRWENSLRSSFFALGWCFLCIYPVLVIILPNLILVGVLLSTYSNESGSEIKATGISSTPAEGSVDYLANLQNIQIMMGRISDASDFGQSLVPHLTWASPRNSLLLLQLSVVSALFLFLITPFIPWRYLFLVAGLSVISLGHPITQSLLTQSNPFLQAVFKNYSLKFKRIWKDDCLSDRELISDIIVMEKIEMESYVDSEFIAEGYRENLELKKGFRWIEGEDWEISKLSEGTDREGWIYLYLDGSQSSEAKRKELGATILGLAQSRRRTWLRRAVRIE